MSQPVETAYLEPFINGTITAAARFRWVLLILIITSILAFTAFWNSRSGSWFKLRVSRVRQAQAYLHRQDRLAQIAREVQSPGVQEDQKRSLLEEKHRWESQDFSDAIQWLKESKIPENGVILRQMAEELEEAHVNSILLLHIPFFGIVLDVNDLGLLGGFTFVVILLWFRFSLWREFNNLRLTLSVAKPEHLKLCYMSLAMQQVLTVPPPLMKPMGRQKPLGKVVRLLYFLPVIVQLAIFIHDCVTFNVGWMVSKVNTLISVSASLSLLALSSLLTYWCLELSRKIDKTWASAAKRIAKIDRQNARVTKRAQRTDAGGVAESTPSI